MAYTVTHNADLRPWHTFRLYGSRCDCMVEYDSAHDLTQIFANATLPHPILPIGGGSNIFFNESFAGTVLHCTDRNIAIDRRSIHVGAAVVLDDLCRIAAANGLWGAESLSGIPGEISGAIVQNAGAYGAEMADIIESVSVYDIQSGQLRELTNADCRFGYRTSRFKDTAPTQPQFIITGARLKLSEVRPAQQKHRAVELTTASTPESVRADVLKLRDSKLPDPAMTGSAGSFFKNPVISRDLLLHIQQVDPEEQVPTYPVDDNNVKVPAAWLIDHCGLKGTAQGGAAVWQLQPLVLVNHTGTATANDVNTLAQHITSQVYQRYGVTLEREVIYIH